MQDYDKPAAENCLNKLGSDLQGARQVNQATFKGINHAFSHIHT
jgi:hypothetical protein